MLYKYDSQSCKYMVLVKYSAEVMLNIGFSAFYDVYEWYNEIHQKLNSLMLEINACLLSTYHYEKEIHCGRRISEGRSYIFTRVIFSHYLCRNTLSWLNNVSVSADSEQRLHSVVWWAFLYSTGSSGGGRVQPALLSIWSGLGWKEHQCRAGWTQTVWSGSVHKAFQCLVVPPGHQ